jgi:hypothetical protein
LPVFRVIFDDAEQTRYWSIPRTAHCWQDRPHGWWRWLFRPLHQWDFAPDWDSGRWDIVVTLLAGLSALSLTGVWLGVRHRCAGTERPRSITARR